MNDEELEQEEMTVEDMKLVGAVAFPIALIASAMLFYVLSVTTVKLRYATYDRVDCPDFSFHADSIYGASGSPLKIYLTDDDGIGQAMAAENNDCHPVSGAKPVTVTVLLSKLASPSPQSIEDGP